MALQHRVWLNDCQYKLNHLFCLFDLDLLRGRELYNFSRTHLVQPWWFNKRFIVCQSYHKAFSVQVKERDSKTWVIKWITVFILLLLTVTFKIDVCSWHVLSLSVICVYAYILYCVLYAYARHVVLKVCYARGSISLRSVFSWSSARSINDGRLIDVGPNLYFNLLRWQVNWDCNIVGIHTASGFNVSMKLKVLGTTERQNVMLV